MSDRTVNCIDTPAHAHNSVILIYLITLLYPTDLALMKVAGVGEAFSHKLVVLPTFIFILPLRPVW